MLTKRTKTTRINLSDTDTAQKRQIKKAEKGDEDATGKKSTNEKVTARTAAGGQYIREIVLVNIKEMLKKGYLEHPHHLNSVFAEDTQCARRAWHLH